jgi:hypothetical protein
MTHEGMTISTVQPKHWSVSDQGQKIQRTLTIRNPSDFRYESLGFRLKFPELIERWPQTKTPPGTEIQSEGALENIEVGGSGSGGVSVGRIDHDRDITFEVGHLEPGRKVEIILISVPDPKGLAFLTDKGEYFVYSICGSVRAFVGGIHREQGFTAPLEYESTARALTLGEPHDWNLYREKYLNWTFLG